MNEWCPFVTGTSGGSALLLQYLSFIHSNIYHYPKSCGDKNKEQIWIALSRSLQ